MRWNIIKNCLGVFHIICCICILTFICNWKSVRRLFYFLPKNQKLSIRNIFRSRRRQIREMQREGGGWRGASTDNAHFLWRICWMNDMLMGNRELISEINMLSFWHSFQRKSNDDDDDAMHSREICTKILLCESFSECSASIWIHFDCSATATAATTMHSSSRLSKLWRKCRTATKKRNWKELQQQNLNRFSWYA